MRLSSLVPTIPANLVASLEANGIRTDVDLLYAAPAFEIYKRLPAKTVTLQELLEYISIVASLSAAPGISGFELYQLDQVKKPEDDVLRSGNTDLDVFVHGLNGRVIEISGDRGSGKSTLALSFTLHSIGSSSHTSAVWIDTTGEFSPGGAAAILAHAKIAETALERIQVSFAFDIETAQMVIEDLIHRDDPNLRFVVVDCITPLLGPLLSAVSAYGHAVMTEFMQQLQSFSRNSGATVLVVNNTAAKGPDTLDRKPALGPSFVLMTDTTLWLQVHQGKDKDPEDSGFFSISTIKSHTKPTGTSLDFRIHHGVIHPA
ncbi:P-loop containing nucleoside triphosphate hydrolase protein [Gymnopilus junonius]|uniref:P-loop containing nucleoside triphosphate hydrolase protein n=1 Tax=Gymnopilus junonius TaxID=109634 RepID=A0A9P5NUZ2_GYMJU|nr:P-loop containing nucleoside triphosphate hydrolase protein [Gymnopilus junonius]